MIEVSSKCHTKNVSATVPVAKPSLIESVTNENAYNQDEDKQIVFGGVLFHETEAGLNYTLRLATEHVQRLSNFLFMPYSFSGPQRNGDQYNTFCSFQTLIGMPIIIHNFKKL